MDISFLTDYMVPVIVGLCLCLGYVLKHWVADVDNKVIPTVCTVVGAALAIWMHWPEVTPDVLLMGVASGLASTGLHQAVKMWFEKNAEK